MIFQKYGSIEIQSSEKEFEAVKRAIIHLRRDLVRVFQAKAVISQKERDTKVGKGNNVQTIVVATRANLDAFGLEKNRFSVPKYREAFCIAVENDILYLIGADRRGTIYAIYDFCESIGVSPWYFFADVPIREKESFFLEEGYRKVDYPSVAYRGIFINDEEELENWVVTYMGEETIGVKTYEHIFELLLRLKCNYIWPAMHVNSFNLKQENGALADRMGIVVGTSHCDMLMRSNNREWVPWKTQKGYDDVEYDYSIPGENRERLKEYWRESVEQNRDFEVSYTLGMRGIHDSGFETKSLQGLTGEELVQGKIALLDSVIKAQNQILQETLQKETLKIFVPYKEVLELYDRGLEVPEDFTLIWVNDNYGYVRRYPNQEERKRAGGNGLYYHNSYWAPPGASYLFICSIPLAHTKNELRKAWDNGIRKIWVTNFGAIKPLEEELTFYARYAWEIGKENTLTENVDAFVEDWIDRTFSGNHGKDLAAKLNQFDQVVNMCKLEHMDTDRFMQNGYGDEAVERMHFLQDLFEQTNQIYDSLPQEEKDAFFQLILMKIHAAYYTNGMYYYADRSRLLTEQKKNYAAQICFRNANAFDQARQQMLYYYNHVMSNGKWNRILTPEDFPPPRTAMYPAASYPEALCEQKLVVTSPWQRLEFSDAEENHANRWIEIANAAEGELLFFVELPDWITINPEEWLKVERQGGCWRLSGSVNGEKRVMLSPVDCSMPRTGQITIWDDITGTKVCYDVETICEKEKLQEEYIAVYVKTDEKTDCFTPNIAVEMNGVITQEAVNAEELNKGKIVEGVKQLTRLGRGLGNLVEFEDLVNASLTYYFSVRKAGDFLLEIERFPSLNSVGKIGVRVIVDQNEAFDLLTESNDEYRGNWKENIMQQVDCIQTILPHMEAGLHKITFQAVGGYFGFSRFHIYTEERKENHFLHGDVYFAPQTLLEVGNLGELCAKYYGERSPLTRPTLYLLPGFGRDTLINEDYYVEQVQPVETDPVASWKEQEEPGIFTERDGMVKIDVFWALRQLPYANTMATEWDSCIGIGRSARAVSLVDFAGREPLANYHFEVNGGDYQIWVCMYFWGIDESHFEIEMDGQHFAEQDLCEGIPAWRYSSEHVYKWVPLKRISMQKGVHQITLFAKSKKLRFEKICIVKGNQLPPADDLWNA